MGIRGAWKAQEFKLRHYLNINFGIALWQKEACHMTFHISQALVIERTIVISITILLFGLVSIGGLWLLRRASGRSPDNSVAVKTPRAKTAPR